MPAGATARSWRAHSAGGIRPGSRAQLRFWGPVGLVAALLTLGMVVLDDPSPPAAMRVVWVAEKTTAAPSGVPDHLYSRLADLVAAGPVDLTAFAVGETAARPRTVRLTATREDGTPEFNEHLRRETLDSRLAEVRRSVDTANVGSQGFSLYAALQAIQGVRHGLGAPLEVWLSATVLTGSVEPLAMAKLAGADPTAAATEVVKRSLSIIDLTGVELHPILLTPIGAEQKPLTPASDAWRSGFVRALGASLHAEVRQPEFWTSTEPAWAQASATPPVEPLADPAPEFPPPRPGTEQVYPIDTVAFVPDEAQLLDRDAAVARIDSIVQYYAPGLRVEVIGYCAAFGNPDSARDLSTTRAAVIGELLASRGVPHAVIHTEGRGFDERANPNEPATSPAQRVVLVKLQPAG